MRKVFSLFGLAAACTLHGQKLNVETQIRGNVQPSNGGTGINSTGATGCAQVTNGVWSISIANCGSTKLPASAPLIGSDSQGNPTTVTQVQNSQLAHPSITLNSQTLTLGSAFTLTATLPGPFHAASTTPQGGVQEATGSAGAWTIPGIATQNNSTLRGASLLGDGSFVAAPQTILDNTLGRNTGSGGAYNLNNSVQERNSHGNTRTVTFATPGISEVDTYIAGKYSTGDFAVHRRFLSPICSLTETSGEGCKFDYTNYTGPTSYTATLSTILTAGTELMTTPLDNCGNAASDGNCSGAQRWLIDKTAAPAYAGTVTALTFPSDSAVGTMTLSGSPNLTPTVTATIPAGVPDTTDALHGDTITVTIAGATGTIPASGTGCIKGPTSAEVDCVNYTSSGTTLTLSGHRWPHSNAKAAPTIYFAPPRTAVFAQDQSYYSSDIGYTVLGNASANSVYWVTQGGGSNSGANLQQFSAFYTASGLNGVTIYPSALVVTTEDPAQAGTLTSHHGYMWLAPNAMTLTVGDTLSETLVPVTSMFDVHHILSPRQFSAGNLASNIVLNENVPTGIYFQLQNLHSRTVAGGGMLPLPTLFPVGVYGNPTQVGAFSSFSTMPMAPQASIFTWQNCQGGPYVFESGCKHDKQWAVFSNQGTGEGFYINQNTTADTYGFAGSYALEVWGHKYWNSPSGPAGNTFITGLMVGVNGCPLNVDNPRGSVALSIGTSGYYNTPCHLVMQGSLRTGTASNTDRAGVLTLASGVATYSFTETYATAPVCTASDATTQAALRVQTTLTTLTVSTATSSTDNVSYICMGLN